MAYDPVQSKDHLERGLPRLLEQFKEKGKLTALLTSYLKQIQFLEDCVWEVVFARTIETATGILLDHIGAIVGRKRFGLNDVDYRIAIRAQIRINRSSGRPEDVIAVANLSVPIGYTVEYNEFYPASIQVDIIEIVTFTVRVLIDNLRAAKAGGVRLNVVYTYAEPSETFTLASGVDVDGNPIVAYETSALLGFGSTTDATLGGKLASVTGI